MSAWVVSRAHIDALVLAGVQWGLVSDPSPERLAELGRSLWAENLASVACRYPDDNAGDRPGPAGFRDDDTLTYAAPTVEVLLSAAGVVKAIDCYEYQACEHPGWRDPANRAADYVRRLREAVLDSLPADQVQVSRHGGRARPAGWEQAPWGVVDLTQIVVPAADRTHR